MSGEMKARVATVISRFFDLHDSTPSTGFTPESLAIAAIEAFEPSDAMIEAGVAAWLEQDTPCLSNEAVIRKIFEAMKAESLK